MAREARRQQIGDQARHRRWAEHLFESLQTPFKEQAVDVMEEVVDVLHGDLEVHQPKRVRQHGVGVELVRVYGVSYVTGHGSAALLPMS